VSNYYGNTTAHPTNPVHVYEDESNPGNQMLRKMGWQEGDGLGKDKDGHRDPIALEGTRTATDKSGIGNSQFITPPIDYRGDGYKESLLRAAKARYDNCK
jgi:RNA-binding protein 5/10